jgi:hypothetical protein
MARHPYRTSTVTIGPYSLKIEEGSADSIDSPKSVGLGPSALAFYEGTYVTDYYYWEDDLGFSASQKNTIQNVINWVLGDYHIIGIDTASIDFKDLLTIRNSLNFVLQFTSNHTLWTDLRPSPYNNYGYKSWALSKNEKFGIDISRLTALADAVMIGIVGLALAGIVATNPASATATIVVGTAVFTILENMESKYAAKVA